MSFRILAIRVDGNNRIGHGHFYRALSLANILSGKYQSFFFHKELDKILQKKIIQQGFKEFKIPKKINEKDEVKIINGFLLQAEKLIVLDGYHFSDHYQLALKEAGFKIINIADEDSSIRYSDVVISQAPRKNPKSNSQIFAGFRYSLLRQEFYNEINNKRRISKTETAFIMFGSSSIEGLASKILRSFLKIDYINKIHIILPAQSLIQDEINPLIHMNADKIHIYNDLSASEIIELIKASDIGFVPSSVASLEVCTVGLGLFCGYSATNQISTYLNHVSLNTIFPLGDLNSVSEVEILRIMISETQIQKINFQIKNQKMALMNSSDLIKEIFENCLS